MRADDPTKRLRLTIAEWARVDAMRRDVNRSLSLSNEIRTTKNEHLITLECFATAALFFSLSIHSFVGPFVLALQFNAFLFSMSDVFRTILEKSVTYDLDSVAKLWIGPKLIVFLFNPPDVELILSSHVYIDKSAEYDFFKPWLGECTNYSSHLTNFKK